MGRVFRSIDDFSTEAIERLLDRASQFADGVRPQGPGPLVGIVFLETSLRTRTGFSAAAHRLGGATVDVYFQRSSEISMPESIHDTLRTVMGYTDVVVARPGVALLGDAVPDHPTPILSGGDRGPQAEHPSQALLDLFGWYHDGIDLTKSVVTIVGDPTMRSVASLLKVFERFPFRPREVRVVTTPQLAANWPARAFPVIRQVGWDACSDADIVYMAGIPHNAADETDRSYLRLTPAVLGELKPSTSVTSPLPNIDEIEQNSFADRRVRAFEYSDWAVYMRMALLELIAAN